MDNTYTDGWIGIDEAANIWMLQKIQLEIG